MGTFKLLCRDVIEALRPLPPNLFHGALCDPPYGLSKNGSAGGFMGKRWDAKVPGVEYWAEVLRVLKPGAPILAFGGTRTYHRLACAIEDAGFEIFDSILGSVWLYGQGFSKGINISKAIDKRAGAERQIIGQAVYGDGHVQNSNESIGFGGSDPEKDKRLVTAPATAAAKLWEGYLSSLKPSWEPIVFARKPLSGTYAENCIEHGCGGLNIDGSRIGSDTTRGDRYHGKPPGGSHSMQIAGPREKTWQVPAGRYPANLILSHHPDCSPLGTRRVPPRGGDIKPNSKGAGPRSNRVYGQDTSDRGEWTAYKGEDGFEEVESWECHPECPVAALDRQSGDRSSTRRGNPNNPKHGRQANPRAYAIGDGSEGRDYRDSGGASRFFYCSKVSTAERNAGLETGRTNSHSTLKPLSLTTYLAKLILPPPHVSSRLLVPFCGTGSEMAGALIAGWGHVVGIDNDPESISTAQDRIPGLIARGTK